MKPAKVVKLVLRTPRKIGWTSYTITLGSEGTLKEWGFEPGGYADLYPLGDGVLLVVAHGVPEEAVREKLKEFLGQEVEGGG